MSNVHYRARLVLLASDLDIYKEAPIKSFAAGHAKAIVFDSAADTEILTALGEAKSNKAITVFKSPTKDDFDAVLTGLSDKKSAFGFTVDVYANYTGKKSVQIVHFFGEDATLSSKPVTVGANDARTLKIEATFKSVDLKHNWKREGIYIEDEDWNR